MGLFSKVKVDDCKNVCNEKGYCFLIPKEFGGGYIRETYKGYGRVENYDWYELLAIWNCPERCKFKDNIYLPLKVEDEISSFNGLVGIDIGCYNKDHAKLKYPLRLVSYNAKNKVYEDYDGLFSIYDENQGWGTKTYKKEQLEMKNYL